MTQTKDLNWLKGQIEEALKKERITARSACLYELQDNARGRVIAYDDVLDLLKQVQDERPYHECPKHEMGCSLCLKCVEEFIEHERSKISDHELDLEKENAQLQQKLKQESQKQEKSYGIVEALMEAYHDGAEEERSKYEKKLREKFLGANNYCDVCGTPMYLIKDKTCYGCKTLFAMKHEDVMKGDYQTRFTAGIHRQALGFAYHHCLDEREKHEAEINKMKDEFSAQIAKNKMECSENIRFYKEQHEAEIKKLSGKICGARDWIIYGATKEKEKYEAEKKAWEETFTQYRKRLDEFEAEKKQLQKELSDWQDAYQELCDKIRAEKKAIAEKIRSQFAHDTLALNSRAVKESELQRMKYIELSHSGILIPAEEVEAIADALIGTIILGAEGEGKAETCPDCGVPMKKEIVYDIPDCDNCTLISEWLDLDRRRLAKQIENNWKCQTNWAKEVKMLKQIILGDGKAGSGTALSKAQRHGTKLNPEQRLRIERSTSGSGYLRPSNSKKEAKEKMKT